MNHFIFSGHDTVELAEQYGTPLYVMSEDILESNIRNLQDAFDKTGADYIINYAGKSFLNLAMCRIADRMGIHLDVSSGGELFTALEAGLDPSKLIFHGNNKSDDELQLALDCNIGRIVIDNEDELMRLDRLTRIQQRPVNVLFRVTPGISAHTHELIQTATEDSKFGIPICQAERVIVKTLDMPYIQTIGIHCHIGSQIIDESPFVLAMDIMMELYRKLVDLGVPLQELDLGGGFGIAYLTEDDAFDVENHIPKVVAHITELDEEKGVSVPTIAIEPGRFISATAGITLYRIGVVKEIPGVKTYVCIDGGMADNPRPALYDAAYEAVVCNKFGSEDHLRKVTVSGRACETDRLIPEIILSDPQVGDILAVKHTGAYNYSMSSNYNRFCRPAVVLLRGDDSAVMVERENYADLIARDRMPDWLK